MPTNPSIATETPSASNTAAVVVLFYPEGDLIARLQRILSQVSLLTVISNDACGIERLAGIDTAHILHIQAPDNIGLAAALNLGLTQAAKQGLAWCLLLDQDTLIDTNLIERLGAVYASYPQACKIGLLAPNYRSPGGARIAYPTNVPWQILETAVTSGSLIPTKLVQQVGGMREDFFIEGIDIEFSLRLRAAGLQIVASGLPLMAHGAGVSEERRLCGRTVLVSHHSPWRCFMQFRNLTWILWHYHRQEPHWARITLLSMFKRYCIVFLFEQQRLRKVWAMLRGTFVGFAQALHTDKLIPTHT